MAKRNEQDPEPVSDIEPIRHSANDVFGELADAQKYLKYLGPIVGVYNTVLGTAVGLIVGTQDVITDGWLEFKQTKQRAELRAEWLEKQRAYQKAMIEAQTDEERRRVEAKGKVEEIRRTWEFIYLENLAKLEGPLKVYYEKIKEYENVYREPDVAAWARLVALRLMVFTLNLAFEDIGMEGRMKVTSTGETVLILPSSDNDELLG